MVESLMAPRAPLDQRCSHVWFPVYVSRPAIKLAQLVDSVQSTETATSSPGGPASSHVGTKSLLDAGPRSSGVSSDTAYAAQHGQQSNPSRFYQGIEGSWMSLQSLQSSLADEPMHGASSGKSAQQTSLDIPTAAAGLEKREGALTKLARASLGQEPAASIHVSESGF